MGKLTKKRSPLEDDDDNSFEDQEQQVGYYEGGIEMQPTAESQAYQDIIPKDNSTLSYQQVQHQKNQTMLLYYIGIFCVVVGLCFIIFGISFFIFYPDQVTIVFIGDEVTESHRYKGEIPKDVGHYQQLEYQNEQLGKGYVYTIHQLLKIKYRNQNINLINNGERGNSIQTLYEDFYENIEKYKPDIINIQIGSVDCLKYTQFQHGYEIYDDHQAENEQDIVKGPIRRRLNKNQNHDTENDELIDSEEFFFIYTSLLDKISKRLPNTKIIVGEPFYFKSDKLIPEFYENIKNYQILTKKVAKYHKNTIYIPYQEILNLKFGSKDMYLSFDGLNPTPFSQDQIAKSWIEYTTKILEQLL